MSNEFPSNSHSDRSPEKKNYEKTGDSEDRPKLEKIVVGEVKTRKKSFGRRLAANVFHGNGVLAYIGKEVLLPAVQNLLVDAATEGIGRLVKGDDYDSRANRYRGGGSYRGSSGSYTDYSSRATHSVSVPRGPVSRPNAYHRGSNNAEEIVVETRAEADLFCDQMDITLGRYGSVTMANMNELLDKTSLYTDYKWGWTDLRGMGYERLSGNRGYAITMPPPEELDNKR